MAPQPQALPGPLGSAARAAVAAVRDGGGSREALDWSILTTQRSLDQWRGVVRATIAVAPLLGLLGTVIGMIETFDSLQDMALFSHSGGIAAGVSKALFTTQLGLLIALPGLLSAHLLDRRQERLRAETEQLKAHLARHCGCENEED
jgi:biopolymer transport protein ExbB